ERRLARDRHPTAVPDDVPSDDHRPLRWRGLLPFVRVGHDRGAVALPGRVAELEPAARVRPRVADCRVPSDEPAHRGIARLALADVEPGIGCARHEAVLEQPVATLDRIDAVGPGVPDRQVAAREAVWPLPAEARAPPWSWTSRRWADHTSSTRPKLHWFRVGSGTTNRRRERGGGAIARAPRGRIGRERSGPGRAGACRARARAASTQFLSL